MNRYFYIDNEGKQKGTFSLEELRSENIKKDTLVWTQGMNEWMRASEVGELASLFVEAAYPPSTAAQPVVPPAYQTNYGQQPPQPTEPMPKTWLIESILATILPFILCGSFLSLLGIIGIVNAAKVESLFTRGDFSGSQAASTQAGKWTKIAMWLGIAWVALWIIGIILIIAFGVSMAGVGDIIGSSGYEI